MDNNECSENCECQGHGHPKRVGDETVFSFGSDRDAAWAFMRRMDASGRAAGYPSLQAPYTVRVK